MKKDFKNVAITFGLIAISLMSGSFLYQKKVESEYVLAAKQQELQNLIDEQQVALDLLNQQLEKSSVVAGPNNVTSAQPQTPRLAPKNAAAKPKPSTGVVPKPVAAQPQTQTTAPVPPVVKAPTPAPAPSQSPVVIKPTRKSRAS